MFIHINIFDTPVLCTYFPSIGSSCVCSYPVFAFVYLLCPSVAYIVCVSACRYGHFPTTGALCLG